MCSTSLPTVAAPSQRAADARLPEFAHCARSPAPTAPPPPLQGECDAAPPAFKQHPRDLPNHKPGQCVLSVRMRAFEWSDGEPYTFWADNLYIRHQPDDAFPTIDLMYWNMRKVDEEGNETSKEDAPNESLYLLDSRLYLTRVVLHSVKAAPELDSDQATKLGYTGLYVEGSEAYLQGARFWRRLTSPRLPAQASPCVLCTWLCRLSSARGAQARDLQL